MSYLLTWSILLCLVAGTVIDTGNVCVVRAASELSAGKPRLAASALLALACAAVVFWLDTMFALHRRPPSWSYPTVLTLVGAAVFASGALVNGACAIGTIGRLARGELSYGATIVGAAAAAILLPRVEMASQPPDLGFTTGTPWLLIVLGVSGVAMFAVRRHLHAERLLSYVTLGVVAALISNWQENWTWLGLVRDIRTGERVEVTAAACVAAVMVGAVVSAVGHHRFRLVWPDRSVMLREAAGGALMATGALLIPGGNDSLLVYGIPSGSPHAIVAYVLMFGLLLAALRVAPLFRRWSVWATVGRAGS